MRHAIAVVAVSVALLSLAATAGADELVKHSGVIVAIANEGRSFVLAEVGPWELKQGRTVTTGRKIALLPESQFAIVGRVDEPPSGFAGDFVEVPLTAEEVYLNDYVTVECRHKGNAMLALKITVIELPDADTREQTLR
jgi:hypothetical protein